MMIIVNCQNCDKPFIVDDKRLKHGRGKSCSRECQYTAIRNRPKKDMVELTCIGCGILFKRPNSSLKGKRGSGKYCTRKCRDANRVGILHPQYINGSADDRRGPNWQSQKRKAIKRDNRTCQHCQRPGQVVHHKKPYRFFKGNYLDANDLSNLITLCAACHRKADIDIQRTERLLKLSLIAA